jgi:hypothetical protein
MAGKEAVTLSEEEVTEIERIVMDRDKDEAFEFLSSVIWKRVKEIRRKHLDPKLGGTTRF